MFTGYIGRAQGHMLPSAPAPLGPSTLSSPCPPYPGRRYAHTAPSAHSPPTPLVARCPRGHIRVCTSISIHPGHTPMGQPVTATYAHTQVHTQAHTDPHRHAHRQKCTLRQAPASVGSGGAPGGGWMGTARREGRGCGMPCVIVCARSMYTCTCVTPGRGSVVVCVLVSLRCVWA